MILILESQSYKRKNKYDAPPNSETPQWTTQQVSTNNNNNKAAAALNAHAYYAHVTHSQVARASVWDRGHSFATSHHLDHV